MEHHFEAKIYKIGINWAVDVPAEISATMIPEKGYIRIKGQLNNFDFVQTLVPVKNSPYRLFVNMHMMKGGITALGEIGSFKIMQNLIPIQKQYPVPIALSIALAQNNLETTFSLLKATRIKSILKYLSYIKTTTALNKNIAKLIVQLKANVPPRIP